MKKSCSSHICFSLLFLAVNLFACSPTGEQKVGRVAENTGNVLRPAVEAIQESGQTTGRVVENAGDVVRPVVNSPTTKDKKENEEQQ